MSIVYDYPTTISENDPAVEDNDEYNERLGHALTPGSYLVDIFPLMKHIPERSEPWHPFHCLVVKDDGITKSDSRSGSGKAYENSLRTLGCSSVFSIVLRLTLYVLASSVISEAQLTG